MSGSFFTFPNPVNNTAARLVAAGVLVMAAVALATGWLWISALIAYGFVARVLAGPRLSPLARLATALAPRLDAHPKLVPGPPKRFAQSCGAAFGLAALGLYLAGERTGAAIVLALLLVPASLEALLGVCVGCELFSLGMRLGLVPERLCRECADLYSKEARARRLSRN